MATQHNPKAYKTPGETVRIVLEVKLDQVPGMGDCVQDHIDIIFAANPYVVSATHEES